MDTFTLSSRVIRRSLCFEKMKKRAQHLLSSAYRSQAETHLLKQCESMIDRDVSLTSSTPRQSTYPDLECLHDDGCMVSDALASRSIVNNHAHLRIAVIALADSHLSRNKSWHASLYHGVQSYARRDAIFHVLHGVFGQTRNVEIFADMRRIG